MHVVELSYVCRHLFLTHLLSDTFTLHYLCTNYTHTLTIVLLCMGISESQAQYSKKKTEQSLQSASRIGKARWDALKKTVVSFDEDYQHSSVVDDPICHTRASRVLCFNFTVSYVVACCIWCLTCIASKLVKLQLLSHIL
jgi:hypothetical protein